MNNTKDYSYLDGYKKIGESGGSYVVATFYNPVTHDVKTKCVRDYDYADCSRDDDYLYHMEIDEEARRDYYHYKGVILKGDTAKVVKGRKVPIGTIGVVKDKLEITNRYGKWVATYVLFENGMKTNIDNCVLIIDGVEK